MGGIRQQYIDSILQRSVATLETKGFQAMSPNEQVCYLVHLYEAEVNNGGHEQFFFNSTGNYAVETVDALKRIEALKTMALLEEAIELFPGGRVSNDREARQEQLEILICDETVMDKLNVLDERFYSYPEDIEGLLYGYLKTH